MSYNPIADEIARQVYKKYGKYLSRPHNPIGGCVMLAVAFWGLVLVGWVVWRVVR